MVGIQPHLLFVFLPFRASDIYVFSFSQYSTEHLIIEKDMDCITWTDKLFILLSTELESLGLNRRWQGFLECKFSVT